MNKIILLVTLIFLIGCTTVKTCINIDSSVILVDLEPTVVLNEKLKLNNLSL